MPTWGQILEEHQLPANRQPNGQPNHDAIRRKYLGQLFQLTGRPIIVYASSYLDKNAESDDVSINLGDVQGFMNAVADLQGPNLDLFITSPGGSAEATESIVAYLRTRFDHIRAIVPVAAMSAAAMLALGCDEIVMGNHSQLGPIDPQFTIFTPDGPRNAPGQAILDQFEKAKLELQDPQNIGAWMPILRSYMPGLLAMCEDQQELAKRMVQQWLQDYMLRGEADRAQIAAEAAAWFADYNYFGSHGRRVSLDDVLALKLKGLRLEDDDAFQDAVLSVHHCYSLTMSNTGTVKIIENHLGRAFVKIVATAVIQQGPAPQPPSLPIRLTPPQQPGGNRSQRRQRDRGK